MSLLSSEFVFQIITLFFEFFFQHGKKKIGDGVTPRDLTLVF
jgi:hypothetical protein